MALSKQKLEMDILVISFIMAHYAKEKSKLANIF